MTHVIDAWTPTITTGSSKFDFQADFPPRVGDTLHLDDAYYEVKRVVLHVEVRTDMPVVIPSVTIVEHKKRDQ